MTTGAELVGRANPTALFVGAVAAVSTIAIGIGLVVFATSGGSSGGGSGGSHAAGNASTTTTKASSTSSTTTTAGAAPGSGSATTTTNAAGASKSGTSGGTVEDPNHAYSDPTDPLYVGMALPAGIGATVSSCAWNSANGGELQASGTISASPETDDSWFVTIIWLQNERELDEQFKMYQVAPGTTVPWRLTAKAPLPPAEPFRCALEVE